MTSVYRQFLLRWQTVRSPNQPTAIVVRVTDKNNALTTEKGTEKQTNALE